MRKLFIALSSVLLLTLSSSVMAQSISERVERADRRIERGIQSGSLTPHEAHRLRNEFYAIRNEEARARGADGHMDHRERDRINNALDRLEQRISYLKHNDNYRDDRRDDRRDERRNDFREERRDDRRRY
jgi:hypothetical protein